jgi:hypothetical protein
VGDRLGPVTPAGTRLTRFYYYGGLDADNKPSGMAPGSESVAELHAKGAKPTREFTAWTQVHAFRGTGATLAMPRIGGAGGGGANRMSGAEEAEVRRWMTPRKVVRDGVVCPNDNLAVSEAQSEHVLGRWQWLYKTRKGGKSVGYQDVLYCPPGNEPAMRSLVKVKAWFAAVTASGTVRGAAACACRRVALWRILLTLLLSFVAGWGWRRRGAIAAAQPAGGQARRQARRSGLRRRGGAAQPRGVQAALQGARADGVR